jgi:hypothetical protein
MVYSPMNIAIGTGYYAENPVVYDSLLKENTYIKNYRAATSMHHEIEYAHAIDKEIDILAKEKYNKTYDPIWTQVGFTWMKVTEDVTDGKIHYGVLQGSEPAVMQEDVDRFAPFSSAWKKPAIEIDEDYFGTYHIEKNMSLEVPYKKITKTDDWLPCCPGGWDSMNPLDRKGFGTSAAGIFDCSCLAKAHAGMYGPTNVKEPFKGYKI